MAAPLTGALERAGACGDQAQVSVFVDSSDGSDFVDGDVYEVHASWEGRRVEGRHVATYERSSPSGDARCGTCVSLRHDFGTLAATSGQ